MDEYYFERLSEDNFKDLFFLYSHTFDRNASLPFLERKYDTDWTGARLVGFLAYHKASKQPAAYYGVFPVELIYKDKKILGAQSGDTMTHPDHRGKGLFIKLASSTYELARDLGIKLVFGFPNQNSYHGFVNKLQWTHYGNVAHFKLKASIVPLDKIIKKFSFLDFISLWIFPQKNLELNELQFPNSLCSEQKVDGFVLHDSNFYKYKTSAKTVFIKEFYGVKCLIKIDGRMWVGDIESCTEDVFNKVILSLVRYAKKLLCSSIQISVMENSNYYLWLLKNYSVDSTIAAGGISFDKTVPVEAFQFNGADFDTF
ncbi:MAG: GNAT family N-acetyltransferase [Bacteroidia bacterium]